MDWKNIIDINEIVYEDWSVGEKYMGKTAEIAAQMDNNKLGFHIEILPPGKFSCPYHFHHSEEELFLVLSGKAMLRQNNQYKEISNGELIYFSTGAEGAHQFYNHAKEDFKFLAISTLDNKDIAEYPDSNKIFIRKSKKMFQNHTSVPYITGEENPEEFWDKKYLNTESS